MTLLDVRNLTTQYKLKEGHVRACEGITFNVDRGEGLGLVGESACGKTTAALSLVKLLPHNGRIVDGSIILDGKDITKTSVEAMRKIRWKEISIIFQGAMNALNPVRTVGEQIMEAIQIHYKVSDKEALARTKRLFERVEMDPDRTKEYPHEFSGGMRQRVMIAMALACEPKVVIGDEPTTALDVMVQAQILQLLEHLRKETKMGLILITHDLSVVGETCEKVAVMYAGKIAEYGRTETVFERPSHPYTQALIGAFPNIEGERDLAASIPGSPPNLIDVPSGCRFHPRCSEALPICEREDPPMFSLEDGHYSYCHISGK